MNEDRIYLGNGKRVGNYDVVAFSVCLSDIPTASVFEYKGKQYVKLVIGSKREPDQWGKTHRVWLDTQKPPERKKKEPESFDIY